MRTLLLTTGLLATLLAFPYASVMATEEAAKTEDVVGAVVAAPIVITPELVKAHHAYQLARLRWQQYRFVELPRQRQLLDNEVRLNESEIHVLRRRLRDYRPFLQVGRYSPVRTAAENDRLALQATEQQLRLLKNERINLMRYSRQNGELYQLDVLRTAQRVRQLVAQAGQAE